MTNGWSKKTGKVHTQKKKYGNNTLANFCQILAVRAHIKLALYKLSTVGA